MLLWMAAVTGVCAQEQSALAVDGVGQVPLMAGAGPREDVATSLTREAAARRAMQMGFPHVAAGILEQLVAEGGATARQDELRLEWTLALLEADDVAGAAAALSGVSDVNTPRVRLRRALIELVRGQTDAAEDVLGGFTPDRLPPRERAWFHYAVGAVADAAGETQAARQAYRAAIQVATSGLQRARFELADLRSSWRVAEPTEGQLVNLRRGMEEYAGEQIGYDMAKRYAAVLAALGREPEAIDFLQNQLLALPAAERVQQDDFRLLFGLIAGPEDERGRLRLEQVVREGVDRQKQRIALRLLAVGARSEAEQAALRSTLGELLNRAAESGQTHPIEQDLLLFRAQLAGTAEEATRDALMLLERYPASDLRPSALGVLVTAAWEERRYRAAAGYAAQARRELPLGDGEVRAQLAVLQAEAFFRARDYRSAADAYAAALDELPAGVAPGDMIFQEVLARILDQQLTEAGERIDLLKEDVRFDVQNRWQAEWKLARALQANGRVVEAYRRVNELMRGDAVAVGALPEALAVRLAWLQVRLALEAGEWQRALDLAPALRARVAGVAEELRHEIESSLRLLEAEAYFGLDRHDEALAMLQALRSEAPNTLAAVYSFIEEANVQASRGQLVAAQRLLTELVEKHPQHRYAPFALYQSALVAEGRREDSFLEEAITKIEELVTRYPDDDLVFYARFKQGDLLRKLNQWEPARQVYELIINQFPNHADVWSAQLALADTLSAQAGLSEPALRESAGAIYERLRDLPTAAVPLRVEAGFKAGGVLQQNGALDRAAETWWQVVNQFLVEPSEAGREPGEELGVKGRYWLVRLLAQLGQVLESQERVAEARKAYELIIAAGLPQGFWARRQLERLGGVVAVPESEGEAVGSGPSGG